MSGGEFDYKQYDVMEAADMLKRRIRRMQSEEGPKYSPATIKRFRECLNHLERGAIYLQRIDWLVSDDDGEESFHERLEEGLKALPNYHVTL